MLDELGAHPLEFLDEWLGFCGDMKPPRATIVGIAHALDQPRLLEAIDDPAQGNRLEFEHFRELDLAKARCPGQPEQHLPLRTRNAKPDREAIERLAQHVRGLADFKR
jgi:hypothetical protein